MPGLKTTFIPKEPITERERRPHNVDPLSFGSWLIFFFALLVAGGLYFYQFTLDKGVRERLDDIRNAKEAIDPSVVNRFDRLDKKLQASREIVNNHLAVSSVFDFLEKETLLSVTYRHFLFEVTPQGKPFLSIGGFGRGYEAVALQAEIFKNNDNFIDPVFSNLGMGGLGEVSFSVRTFIDGSSLLFSEYSKNSYNQSVDEFGKGTVFPGEVVGDIVLLPEDTETSADISENENDNITTVTPPVSDGVPPPELTEPPLLP
jgi:hypothetical protein